MESNKNTTKLPKAPLQEVIFELVLNQDVDSNGVPTENHFDLAQGVFNKLISNDFSHRETKSYPSEIKIFPRIKHQYWKKENEWPVVQIGPGILTVNDTEKNYLWNNFSSITSDVLKKLVDSYPNELDINRVSLRYIDAVELNVESSSEKLNFINENFKVNLINDFSIDSATLKGLSINQTYSLPDKSIVNFAISDGKSKRDLSAIVWQTQISNSNIKSIEDIISWLEEAHSVSRELFKKTINNDFYEQFK